MSIKVKALREFTWILFEGIFSQGSLFIIGLILARLLTPEDFGLIGIINAILIVLNSVVEGGYLSALVRKDNLLDRDLNTVFFVNIVVSLVIYVLLFLLSNPIAQFFETPILEDYIRIMGLVLLINALGIINRVLLIRALDFKTQAIISSTASVLSGIIAVVCAFMNYGIMSLVLLHMLRPIFQNILLWIKSKWAPKAIFSWNSFINLSNFGIKLLLANLINTIYKNGYYFLIGKVFQPSVLGYYTRAEQFQIPISNNISNAIKRLSFPILSRFKREPIQLRNKFRRFLRFSMFLNFNLMFVLLAISDSLIITLIGPKWKESILMLKILCIPGALYPLQVLHLNLLLIKGYSNLNLKLEIIKKVVLIPLIIISVYFGIQGLLIGIALFAIIEYFINSYYSKKIVNYSLREQVKDIMPFLFSSLLICVFLSLMNFIPVSSGILLLVQCLSAVALFIIFNEIMQLEEYVEGKDFILNTLSRKRPTDEKKY